MNKVDSIAQYLFAKFNFEYLHDQGLLNSVNLFAHFTYLLNVCYVHSLAEVSLLCFPVLVTYSFFEATIVSFKFLSPFQ